MIGNPFRFYQVLPPAPTYFGGTLPEVVVSSDDTSYPYYNELTSEERKYFNQNNPIGRAVRSIASTGKRGETANDLREIARGVEEFGAEMTGIPGSIRFSQDPIKKLKGLGRTVEATMLGSAPFITAPYNKEDVADAFDALDALGFATTAAGLAKMPFQKAANLAGRYLTQGPLRNAYRLNPVAAKQPTEVILSRVQRPGQTADLSRLDELSQRPPESLTLAERVELARINQPGYGRGFSSNPYDIAYYSSPGIQSSRGYVGMPEIRSIRLPAEEAARFNIRRNPVEGYFSSAPSREYLLPRNYVESSKTLTPQTFEELDQIRRSIDAETTALNTPHWLRGYPTINTPTGNVTVGNPFRPFSRRELMPNIDNIQPMMNEIGEYIDPVVTSPAPRMTQAEANELLRQYNLRRYGTANPIVNKSGLDKDRAIALSPESKSMVESMSDKDFQNTVLSLNKGGRKIVNAPNDKEAAMYLLGKNKVKMIPTKDWIDEFNSNLSELNENIVPKLNRSGVSYEFLPMKEIPSLPDYAELGLKSTDKDGKEVVKGWTVKIKPGKFKGEIQDVAGEDYMNSIPGLQVTNSGEGVFDKNLYAPGSNAYRALNDYLKSLDLGRVSSGKSGLSDKGKKAWETHLLNDRAIGFAHGVGNSGNPDIYAIMKTMSPYIMPTFGAGYGIGNYYRDNNR